MDTISKAIINIPIKRANWAEGDRLMLDDGIITLGLRRFIRPLYYLCPKQLTCY